MPAMNTTRREHPVNADPSGHAWERWFPYWNVAFYGLVALSAALAAPDIWRSPTAGASPIGWRGVGLVLAVCTALVAWHRLLVARPGARVQVTGPMLLYLVGATVFYVVLTVLHPVFMLLTFLLYAQLFSLLRLRWAVLLVGPFSVVVWWRSAVAGGSEVEFTLASLLIFAVALAVSIGLALFIDSIIDESAERHRLIAELRETRDELAAAEHQSGMLAERQRLAREIHDTLAQGFTSVVMHLEAAEGALPAGLPDLPPAVGHHLDQARQTARESLTEARRLVWALRPASLDDGALPAALERVAERWSLAAGIPASVTVTGPPPLLHPEVEVTLLRAAQEALANIRQHASATRVAITLSFGEETAMLDVRDDGMGFDVAATNGRPGREEGGFGLHSMRERVARIGGALVVESAAGAGTTVAVAVPALAGPVAPVASERGPR